MSACLQEIWSLDGLQEIWSLAGAVCVCVAPARARRRPAMGTGQLRSLLAAAASLAWLGFDDATLGDE